MVAATRTRPCVVVSPATALMVNEIPSVPRRLASIHPEHSTPHVAIGVTTLLTAVLALFFDYRQLVGMSNVTVVIQYLFTCLAVPVLRKKLGPVSVREGGRRPWRIPGGSLIPLLGAAGSLVLFAAADKTEWLFAAATLVVGVGVAWVTAQVERKA